MKREDLKIFVKIPTINTERLTLRKITQADLNDVYEYGKDTSVSKYLLWSPHPDEYYTRRYLAYLEKKYKEQEFHDWGIEFCGKMIGTVGFTSFDLQNNSAEIGYVLNSSYWGKGIAAEAAKEIIKFGFERLGLARIFAKCLVENEVSKIVMKKCNMQYEGILRAAVLCKNQYKDVTVYAITAEDYFRKDK